MIAGRRPGVNSSSKVVLWLVGVFLSTLFTMLLIFLLSAPIAWLAVALDLSATTFLAIAAIPTLLSILIVQLKRLGERVVNTGTVVTTRQSADLGGIRAMRHLSPVWLRAKQFKKDSIAEWSALYDMVQRASKEVSDLLRAISQHESVIRKLRIWTRGRSLVLPTVKQVSRVVERQRLLQTRIQQLIESIRATDREIRRTNATLERDLAARRAARQVEWNRLKSQMEQLEESIDPTFWGWAESSWRRWRLAQYDHSYRHRTQIIEEWLALEFDPVPLVANQHDLLQQLADQTIQCRDGHVDLHLIPLE